MKNFAVLLAADLKNDPNAKVCPINREALHALGIAACHMLRETLSIQGKAMPKAFLQVC